MLLLLFSYIAKKTIEGLETDGGMVVGGYSMTSWSKTTTTYKQTTPYGIAMLNQEGKKMVTLLKLLIYFLQNTSSSSLYS